MLKNFLRNRRTLVLLVVTAAILASSSVAALAAGSASVKVGDDWFKAKTVTVNKGGKVIWNWVGHLDHNVTVMSGPAKFHSRIQARGNFSHVFTKAGTYHLECTLHPNMKMTVVVK
jgi:plastocyanin